jgi:D-alanine-D-alanine ligase-like ATP-grasp enzyme
MSEQTSYKLRVGVVRGGPGSQYEESLASGKHVLDALRGRDTYTLQDIFIDRNGVWHVGGLARQPERIFPHIDIAINAVHEPFAQAVFESHRIPFTGSGSVGASLGANPTLAKKILRRHGVLVPEHVVVRKGEHTPNSTRSFTEKYPHLRFVRGVGSFVDHEDLYNIAENHFASGDHEHLIVEEEIRGRPVVCAVIEGSTPGELYALKPIGEMYTSEIEPVQQAAVAAHKALGLRHYSVPHLIVNRFGPHITSVSVTPPLRADAPFAQSLAGAGLSLADFLDHIIGLSLRK